MPMIPQDMDKCHARTLKDRAEKKIRQKDYRAKQKALNKRIEELKAADMDIFLCRRT